MAQYYTTFFLGVIEISSIPLVIVDVFHPKHFQDQLATSAFYDALNSNARILFAVAFLAVRAVYFPVVIFRLLSDLVKDDVIAFSREGNELQEDGNDTVHKEPDHGHLHFFER